MNMSDAEYLNALGIVKLQTAARMAGLRFKNGAAGYDRAGILAKLTSTPSVMRAAAAVARRMEGENLPVPSGATPAPEGNPFAQDIEEEAQENPLVQPAVMPAPMPVADAAIQALQQQVKTALFSISDLRVADQNLSRVIGENERVLSALKQNTESRLAALEERRPTVINIPALPSITLDGSEHVSYRKLLAYLHINRRVILTGSAGTGKSIAAHNAAKHFNLPFYLQTPVTMDHQYLGHRDASGNFHSTPTFEAYTKGGLLLWDEADAGLPDAMLAANPIFDGNGFATFGDGVQYKQHPDFLAIFNMNTSGNGATMQYAGRNRLDGATLARFGVRIHWEIDPRIEAQMALGLTDWLNAIRAVRTFMEQRQIMDVNATPRHTKTGALILKTLGADITRAQVLTDVLKSGALAEVWSDIERLPAVVSFLRG